MTRIEVRVEYIEHVFAILTMNQNGLILLFFKYSYKRNTLYNFDSLERFFTDVERFCIRKKFCIDRLGIVSIRVGRYEIYVKNLSPQGN